MQRLKFVAVMRDDSTDSALLEKEYIYISFVDPDTFRPTLVFFALKDLPSQDAFGVHSAIAKAYTYNGLKMLLDNHVFLVSDGASVNSGIRNGLIRIFQRDKPWIVFIWCLTDRLELV